MIKDRRVVLALVGGAIALAAGVLIALGLNSGERGAKTAPPPASQGGLVVEAGPADDGSLDPARPLRCFVAGQFVGEITLAECANRNGVATGALDVGVDETGALSAADQAGANFTPLPPAGAAQPSAAATTPPPNRRPRRRRAAAGAMPANGGGCLAT